MRFLQLSDLHFGYDNNTVADMRSKLLGRLDKLGPFDYLFLTGDFRYAKNITGGYPKDLIRFLEDIIDITKIPVTHVFMVPGNHDVDRGLVRSSVIEKIKADYKVSDGRLAEDYLAALQAGTGAYAKLHHIICGSKYQYTHSYTELKEINIIQLNTALVCGTDQEDGSLIVGMMLLRKALKRMNTDKPAIVLAHHGFDCLNEEEQRNLEILLKEQNAVLYLCGHKHKAYCTNISVMRQSVNLWEYLCGTNMDKSPQLESTDMDFFVGELDPWKKEGFISAYKWSRNCCDWMADQDFSYAQNGLTDGRHYFSQKPAYINPAIERLIPDAENAYKKYLVYEYAKMQFSGLPVDNTVLDKAFDLELLYIPRHFHKLNDYSFDRKIMNFSYYDDLTIVDLIPENPNSTFRIALQADLGSGKTTLLKRVAIAYAMSDQLNSFRDGFSHRKLFPIWIRCRTYNFGQSMVANIINTPWKEEPSGISEETTAAFKVLVERSLADGTAVLLVDGLDEIEVKEDRLLLIDQLNIFMEEYQKANIILTSRIAGYSDINQYLEKYTRYVLNPFTKKDIKDYCIKWYKVVAPGSNAEQDGSLLAESIIKDMNVCKLAENPLLLTTLLLVHRRLGCLPNKRADLYKEAIRVLIETWDEQKGILSLDYEKTRYQLAYIAYSMVADGNKKLIRKSAVTELINAARENRKAWFSKENKAAELFLDRVEQRSTLLLQQGYEYNDKIRAFEASYEFRHLGFRDYLAAMAIVKKFYFGAKRDDRPCDLLEPFLENRNLAEVVIFSTIMDPSDPWAEKDVEDIVDLIIEKIKLKKSIEEEYSRDELIDLLLRIVADEAPLSKEKINRIFEFCLSDSISSDQIPIFENLLLSNSGPLFESFCNKTDSNRKYRIRSTMISVLKNKSGISPYEYYIHNRKSGNPELVIKAINRIDIALWMGRQWVKEELSDKEMEQLYHELYDFTFHEHLPVAEAALHAIDSLTSLSVKLTISPEEAFPILLKTADVVLAMSNSYMLMRLAGKLPVERTFLLKMKEINTGRPLSNHVLESYAHENVLSNKIGFFWFIVFLKLWSINEVLQQADSILNVARMHHENKKEYKQRLAGYFTISMEEGFYNDAEKRSIYHYFDSHLEDFYLTDQVLLPPFGS